MAVTYTFEEKITWVKMVGNHTFDETREVFQALFEDPKFQKGKNVLIDARESKEKRTKNELAALADFFGSRKKSIGRRVAMLVNEENRDQEEYERFLSAISDRSQVEFFVFFSHEDALHWLTAEN